MKRYWFFGLLLSAAALLFGASEELEMYTRLYNGARTFQDRLGILRSVQEDSISDAVEFYAMAIHHVVVEYPNVRGNQELEATEQMVRLLAQVLGEAKHRESAADLFRAEEIYSNPLVKADIIMALGKMGATEFLPQLVQLLKDLNSGLTTDRLAGEQVAFGLIDALENFADPSGYLPVFMASIGWYNERVKSRAVAALPRILADPAEPLTEVINSPGYAYTVKFQALQNIENAQIAEDKKAAVAVAAFTLGWNAATNNSRERMNLVNIRKFAIDMIRRYGTEDPAVYRLLERSYKEGVDNYEKEGAVHALSALATDDSARLLGSFVMLMNDKLQAGTLTRADDAMLKIIIPDLGATKRSAGAPALRSVLSLDWTNAVKNLAREALRQMQ
jgi:hypothetical protein